MYKVKQGSKNSKCKIKAQESDKTQQNNNKNLHRIGFAEAKKRSEGFFLRPSASAEPMWRSGGSAEAEALLKRRSSSAKLKSEHYILIEFSIENTYIIII
jgi:hypothetical protein